MRPLRILWSQAALLRKIRQRQSRAPRTPGQRNGSAKEAANRMRFLRLCEAENLPTPVYEHKFHPERKWRFDFAWPEQKVALEVQGGLFVGGRHARGAGIARDMEKASAAASLGWRLLLVQPNDLCTLDTLNLIRKTIAYEPT